MVFWFPLVMVALALLCAFVAVQRAPRPLPPGFAADRLIRYIMLFPMGIQGLWGALGHLGFPAETAASIGWAPSPFQFEVGVCNLGIGVVGLIAAFYARWNFRLALAIYALFFLGGAAWGHVIQMMTAGNFAPGNAGPIFFTDILTPLSLLILLAWTRRTAQP
ncbi:DUF6790 family protein [Aquabacter spiritensis]|uniref:DoxX-like protein n=1 Tax=Aquabacter spiritensis TaxID=933073 RepID=A0A4R3M5H4_9HYPH|nr:DUF6790 family protein [Aquabacter spiritensis]TCT08166.1 hypothetical protein EDC64_101688 [Aquabacter spiritensis]